MKNIINGLIMIAVIIILTVIGGTTFGFLGGLIGFVAGLVIFAIVKRATLLFLIGNSKYTANKHEEAYKWMKKAYETTKLAPSFSLTYAYLMIRDGKLTEAEAVINKVTYLNRRTISKEDILTANLNRAIIKWKQDNLDEAIEILEDMYKEGLKSTNLYGTLGYFYILDNQLQRAMEFNIEGYEYNSDNMIICDNLGASYILNSEFEKADEIYSKLFKLEPQFIEPYYNYGMLMEKRGRYDLAREYYEKALKYPEKYLSTIKHIDIEAAIENVEMFAKGERGEEAEIPVKKATTPENEAEIAQELAPEVTDAPAGIPDEEAGE